MHDRRHYLNYIVNAGAAYVQWPLFPFLFSLLISLSLFSVLFMATSDLSWPPCLRRALKWTQKVNPSLDAAVV